ncbi:MAG: sigma-70 family RNA polymerase sigma factor [Gemmataceae bacterium]
MDPGAERDEWLMAQVAFDRSDLLEYLIRRHATGLLTFLTRMTGDAHRAEELFQEVFLAVWLKRRQYQHPRPFRPWLYAIAMNRCRADFRVRKPVPHSLDSQVEPAACGASPEEQAISAEVAGQVSDAVTQLPPQQRAVVVLRIWQGLPYARIAEIVGCTEGTVRSHMHHALAGLRAILDPLVQTLPAPEA